MLVVLREKSFQKIVANLHADAVKKVEHELSGIKSLSDLSGRVKELREQIETMEVEKGRRKEEGDRREREIEHKIGLERKRQEFEMSASKREATLAVREENLKADRDRFEQQMKFQEERFTTEVGYLKELLTSIMERLPSAEFTADLSPAPARRR